MNATAHFGKLIVQSVDDISILSDKQTLGWQINAYNFPSIWAETKGKGIKVAVVDTSIDANHPDLVIAGGYDFIYGRPFRDIMPEIGHGTHVAGIIGARDNEKGIMGVAPECELYTLAVLGEDGSGSYSAIIKAIDWCIQNKMDVINMSLGGSMDTPEFYAAIRRAYDAKIPIICAAGNSAWETGYIDFPGCYNETISIASITPDFQLSDFSSIGANIDICAPGSEILSCTPNGTYSIYSGTSMATPFVTGLVALMIAKHRMYGGNTPINNVEDVREHLIKVAKDVEYEGRDSFTGYGLVNPVDSINYEKEESKKEELPQQPPIKPDPSFIEIVGLLFGWFGKLLSKIFR